MLTDSSIPKVIDYGLGTIQTNENAFLDTRWVGKCAFVSPEIAEAELFSKYGTLYFGEEYEETRSAQRYGLNTDVWSMGILWLKLVKNKVFQELTLDDDYDEDSIALRHNEMLIFLYNLKCQNRKNKNSVWLWDKINELFCP